MQIVRYEAPCRSTEIQRLLADVFDESEGREEGQHLGGRDAAYQLDIAYAAEENGIAYGSVHMTIPRNFPAICALSGMCTRREVRGQGLGKKLFGYIVDEIRSNGIEAAYLGTSNPVAAKMYHSFGFSFLPGSNVMAWFADGDQVDFEQRYFSGKSEPDLTHLKIQPGSVADRIPIIPLSLRRGPFYLMDVNAGMLNCSFITQKSCMGIHAKYGRLLQNGGDYSCVYGQSGAMVFIASRLVEDTGCCVDFFGCEAVMPIIADLVSEFIGQKDGIFFKIGDTDYEKIKIVEKLGFKPREKRHFVGDRFIVPVTYYRL